ncbi:MAG TPA: hydrogen peroxide-dependent heme synthase [Gemmatimonadaceae bacterium]|nr:hydrogen peroxide-dependent heme synthase [Gemmatimonadaceae bacterium]
MANEPIAHPPETLEGWYALHQIFRFRQDTSLSEVMKAASTAQTALQGGGKVKAKSAPDSELQNGWSCVVRLIGSTAHLMVIHFRESLDMIGEAEERIRTAHVGEGAELVYSFLSVTEAGLYHITADLARAAAARGGQVGDAEYTRTLAGRVAAERDSDHVKRRLYPQLPPDMPYVCFYPMSKRRDADQNWYTLTLDERSRLMYGHGLTGRRYAGRVQQIITGAIGFDAWEWGVTLFAKDPLDFKKLVTDMRFDEVSAKYAEFGDFYVGKVISA